MTRGKQRIARGLKGIASLDAIDAIQAKLSGNCFGNLNLAVYLYSFLRTRGGGREANSRHPLPTPPPSKLRTNPGFNA